MVPSPSGYAKLSVQEDVADGAEVDAARDFPFCPHESVRWPELHASWWSRLVFGWYEPLIKLGARTSLELSDLWHLDPTDAADANSEQFWMLWEEELERAARVGKKKGKEPEPWLGRPIAHFTWRPLIKAAIMRFTSDMLSFARPLLMQQILLLCEGSPAIVGEDNAYWLAIGMATTAIAQMLLGTHYDNVVNRVSFRLRCAVVGMLFKKTIDLSTGAKASYSSGKIVNMMSNDAMKMMQLVRQINYAWSVPFNFVFALYLLVSTVGYAAYAGVVLVAFVMPPLMAYWMKKGSAIRKEQMKQTDQRSKEMTEVLTSIRIIKFMSWEDRFIEKVTKTRDEELRLFRKSQMLNTGLSAVFMTLPVGMTALVIGLYGYGGGEITASMAFTTITLMNMVRGPLTTISWILNSVFVDGKTSVDRLSRFMLVGSIENYVEMTPYRADQPAVELKDLTIQQ